MTQTSNTALITGASGGIGLELARVFAENGYGLVLVARRAEKLESLAEELRGAHSTPVEVLSMDLSQSGAAENVFRETTERGLEVDVLVNNAGFALYGPFHAQNQEHVLEMIQLNVAALTQLTHLFLPGMMERRNGMVMNVASTAAFQPGPLMAGYFASKSYVLHFSEAVAVELEGTGVTFTTLCPGPTASDFQTRANMEDSKLLRAPMMSSRKVAEIGYRAMLRGKTVVIPGVGNKVGAFAGRFLPRKMLAKTLYKLQAPET
ncbi:MAG: SDR family NAD(P)-dependent oxidoreductase [Spirochaetota bacterium]